MMNIKDNGLYQICTKTIMDSSDPNIIFNSTGESDYYTNFNKNILPNWHTDQDGLNLLQDKADKIKKAAKGKDYDCLIGLSGGLDSSYTLYVAKVIMGLNPLAFHVDAGWNSAKAVSNIAKLVDKLNVDLYTEVIAWSEMKDLQSAFLKSQIADQDMPQDVAFFSALYRYAKKNKFKYILTGSNYSTECCREPEEWGAYPGIDTKLILDIHKKFGQKTLKTFPMVDIIDYKIFYQYFLRIEVIKPLNFVPYTKKAAEEFLYEKFGWEKFKHKHHESIFTRFYEDFWLPKRFGFEKRRAHFSSLILTGQMTRDEALERISKPELTSHEHSLEFEYIADKLDFSVKELNNLFLSEKKMVTDYKNKKRLINFGAKGLRQMGIEKRLFR